MAQKVVRAHGCPMPSVEETTKQQFARTLTQKDWHLFKRMAEFYLRLAVFLKKRDVHLDPNSEDLRLLARNSLKRLYIDSSPGSLYSFQRKTRPYYGFAQNRICRTHGTSDEGRGRRSLRGMVYPDESRNLSLAETLRYVALLTADSRISWRNVW